MHRLSAWLGIAGQQLQRAGTAADQMQLPAPGRRKGLHLLPRWPPSRRPVLAWLGADDAASGHQQELPSPRRRPAGRMPQRRRLCPFQPSPPLEGVGTCNVCRALRSALQSQAASPCWALHVQQGVQAHQPLASMLLRPATASSASPASSRTWCDGAFQQTHGSCGARSRHRSTAWRDAIGTEPRRECVARCDSVAG